MANQSQDVCVCVQTPDYPYSDLASPIDVHVPSAQDDSRACPECHRTFQQAGMLERYLRQVHGFVCDREDKYQPLRDSLDRTSTSRHCLRSFANMYILKDHINKHACAKFDAAQGTVTPISARAELRMHLRHQSFQGLLLDQSLCAELSTHCAFCHTQVPARAMHRHYTESHPELLVLGRPNQDRVQGTANFGSGPGVRPLCQTRTQKVQLHQCAVTFQIAIMTGYTVDGQNPAPLCAHFSCCPLLPH